MVAEVVGWIGSICFAMCGVPQAYKCIRQGHADGLSPWFLLLWFVGEICYVGAVLLQFGWVGWMMFNYVLNIVCIVVIGVYYFRPKG